MRAVALLAVGSRRRCRQVERLAGLLRRDGVVERPYSDLLAKGTDIASATQVGASYKITLVLSPAQAKALKRRRASPSSSCGTSSAARRARRPRFQKSTGYNVWMDYDGPDGMAAEMKQIARHNPDIASLEYIGQHRHRAGSIWGIKLTEDARWVKDGKRPAVLYSSTQHAREWIAAETNRRLLHWYIDQYRAKDKRRAEAARIDRALVRPRS